MRKHKADWRTFEERYFAIRLNKLVEGIKRMARHNENDVYELEVGDVVSCYFCIQHGKHHSYRRGEAYLCSPGSPSNPGSRNANYVCKNHLDRNAIVIDVARKPEG